MADPLSDQELALLRELMARHTESEMSFRPEGQILAQELNSAGELTGFKRDYDMATGLKRESMVTPSIQRARMRMDGMGAGPVQAPKNEEDEELLDDLD